MRIAICDDSKEELSKIQSILDTYKQQNISVTYHIFHSGAELLATVKSGAYDLYCRFVKDVLHILERKKNIFRSLPVEWSHRKLIIIPLPNS